MLCLFVTLDGSASILLVIALSSANMSSYQIGDEPTISILLLGDDEVGKSTFLSYVLLSVLPKSYPNMRL